MPSDDISKPNGTEIEDSNALVPSGENPGLPLPNIVLIMPFVSILRITCAESSAKYKFPMLSKVISAGELIRASMDFPPSPS